MRIGLLSQWYAPEPGPASLPTELAKGLAGRGHEVIVLTGYPNYPTGKLYPGWKMRRRSVEKSGGVQVERVPLYADHGSSAIGRIMNYGTFGLSALLNGATALAQCDAVWVNYSPVTVGLPMLFNRYIHRVPTVTHVLDLWPDTLAASGFIDAGSERYVGPAIEWWCSRLYEASSSVAYISPGVGNVLRDRKVPAHKLSYIPMWANESIFHDNGRSLRSDFNISDEAIVVLYAGTMGGAQGLQSLLDAASKFRRRELVVLLAGSGTEEAFLRKHAAALETDCVTFLGRQPASRMSDLYATADVSFVSLSDHTHSRITMPSKIQASLSAGKAILVAGDGDAASVVEDSDAGFTIAPSDPVETEEALHMLITVGRDHLREMGGKARQYYENKFSVEVGVAAVERLLVNAAK